MPPPGEELVSTVSLSALSRAPFCIIVTNADLEDNPIVYVNQSFETVTGYSRNFAVGRNCRFLQGPESDPGIVTQMREAVANFSDITVELTNYRADGSPFRNRVYISPLDLNGSGTRYMLGVQIDLTESGPIDAAKAEADRLLSEIQHRVKNHLAMIVGMIRVQGRQSEAATEQFDTLSRRVETLQLLYEEMNAANGGGNSSPIALGAYLTRVANAIAHLDGRQGVRVNLDADAVSVPLEPATRIGLVVSEVLTNALQHAFPGRDAGLVEMRVKELSNGVLRVQVSDDGVGLPKDVDWPNAGNLGGRIVRQLVRGLDAKLAVEREITGTIVTLDIPKTVTTP